jgi:hypothetical protein
MSLLAGIASVVAFSLTTGSAPGRTVAQPVSGTVVLSGWSPSSAERASLKRDRGVRGCSSADHYRAPGINVDSGWRPE